MNAKSERATAVSWKINPMPPAHKQLPLDGFYTPPEYQAISMGFVPRTMEDKWFIYLEGEWLHFHRSWTGNCIYQLQIIPSGEQYQATQAIVNREPAQYRPTDDAYDVAMIAFLIDTLLLQRFATLPTPGKLSPSDSLRYQKDILGQAPDTDLSLPMLH